MDPCKPNVAASVAIAVGNGARVRFWEDPWLQGQTVATVAPAIYAMVPHACKQRMMVQEGRMDHAWTRVIAGELSVHAVV